MDAITLIPLYLAAFGSAVLLLVSLESLQTTHDIYRKVLEGLPKKKEEFNTERKEVGKPPAEGDVIPSFGLQHYALIGGIAATSLGLLLAGVLMHRRLWARLLGFVVLSFLPALAVVWMYREQVGVIDVDLKQYMPW
jgi:hypothetical protein